MPNFDKTGPTGNGPTGFGRGGCNCRDGNTTPCPQGRGFGVAAQDMTLDEEEKMLEERLIAIRKVKTEQKEA